ncbi:hypothetical protein ACQ4PT_052805 [Festuca glaucescens]
MVSIAMEYISDDDDYLPLPPVEEEDGDDYMHLEEDDDSDESICPEDLMAFPLRVDLTGYIPVDIIEQDPTASTSEVLNTVEAPCDDGQVCPICLQDDDADVWKETPFRHRFHGRCVERWLHTKGSCPMCRRQVVTVPTMDGTHTAVFRESLAILERYGQGAAWEALQMVISFVNY